MVNGNNIPIIGQDKSEMRIQHYNWPLANQSAAAIVDDNGEAVLKIVGGFSKLDDAAIKLGAAIASSGDIYNHPLVRNTMDINEMTEDDVNPIQALALTAGQCAAAILNVCQQMQEGPCQEAKHD